MAVSVKFSASLFMVAILAACRPHTNPQTETMKAPIAPKKNKVLSTHGIERLDPYYWLNERENPEVIAYLEAENAYREFVMKGTEALQDKLFNEIKGRIKEEDNSVPYRLEGYYYYTRYETGSEHPIYCRKAGNLEAPEDIMLDVNLLAQNHAYYQIGGLSVSSNKNLIAYGEDTVSRRIFTIKFKNLETGETLIESIPNTTGSFVWANDNKTGFYSVRDEALRSYKIFRHTLGTPASQDVEVFHEADETFNTYVYKTKSKEFIVIGSGSTVSDEFQLIPANNPTAKPVVFNPRQRGLEYRIAHFKNEWYILTNHQGATNFKIMVCPENQTGLEHWTDKIAHRPEVLLEDFQIFENHLVIDERENGLNRFRIIENSGNEHYIEFGEEAYSASLGNNPEFETTEIRYNYTSLTTPNSVLEYNMNTRSKKVLKEQEVVGGYNKELYKTERIWATAPDGTQVPISLVYKKSSFKKDGSNPVLIYGYGSYGATIDARFSSTRLSLLDRGFVYAIAHIRGGQYLGRPWYDNGKLLHKMNTFTDFIACTEHLQNQKYSSPAQTFAEGGSAGGLLIGAVINLKPSLYKGVIAAVPFVDVVTTMLDESIPLTTGEYDEWGNPNDKTYFDYMLSYSPYDNVKAQHYPAILVTTGLHDSQVQYWEPAKWVARLRELKKDQNPLLLYTNMETGHSGASGRFAPIKETAMEYAFLLDLMGINQ